MTFASTLMSTVGRVTTSNDSNNTIAVACLALLTYDTLLNVDMEYRHIWKSKGSLIKCLYLWSRYATFLDVTLEALRRADADVNLDPAKCTAISTFISVYSTFGIGITEIILMVRTYALYGRSKKLLGFFLIMWLSIAGFCTWAAINCRPVPKISCDLYSSSNVLLACFIALLAAETVIVGLTVWKAIQISRTLSAVSRLVSSKEISVCQPGVSAALKSQRLVTSFYRDVTLIVVLRGVAPAALKPIGEAPLRVMHSILACHLVIHVRAVASEQEDEANAVEKQPPIVFARIRMDRDSMV
ncbi:hypothetical protein B0H14DRAFT_2720921 [Mycena olivaceomarginata]|nr:hypothetical protein B0H14DRAFT_2720921 [Mycena olivaceomarginata]